MSDRFTVETKIGVLLQQPGVMNMLNELMPGMEKSPHFNVVKEASIKDMSGQMPDERIKMLMALVELANGREFNYVKSDEPELPQIIGKNFAYNIDEVDGHMYMMERRFSGCLVLRFSKLMDVSVYGRISCNGHDLPQGLIVAIDMVGGVQMLGVPVRDAFVEYGHEYILHMEGFKDMEGFVMRPQSIIVKTLPRPEVDPAYAEHDGVALEAAREGIVLLKNENNALPLAKDSRFALYGARDFRIGTAGAGRINPRYSIGLLRGIDEYSNFTINEDADAAVIVISRGSGENLDGSAIKGEFYLTDDEEKQIMESSMKYKKTVAVINSGYPMDLRWVEQHGINAVIWCGYPGMLGGKALVEVLDGRVNPSGKLPDTWSLDYYDIPASANFYNAVGGNPVLSTDAPYFMDTVYEEDIYVGYRYFETFNKPIMYPFGFGMSYTNFTIKGGYSPQGAVTATVSNDGAIPGKDVVQVYVGIPDGKLEQPSKRLVGYAKTRLLTPGESQELTIEIPKYSLSSYDTERACWVLEKGSYSFFLGNSVQSLTKCGEFTLSAEEVLKQVENRMVPPVAIEVMSKKNPAIPAGRHSGIKEGVTSLEPKSVRNRFIDLKPEKPDFVDSLEIEELARLSVCASSGWGMHQAGEAGRVFKLHNIPDYVAADGNNGLNLNKPNIGMPSSNTVCASFNNEMAYQVGRVLAEEAKENGIHLMLAPGMNIHRNPLNGRHPEYFSEDPYLAGTMAGHHSKGLEENGVSSCLKHTVANNCETVRKRNQSILTERALREIYIKAFETAMSVHMPDSIMTGYNAVNGVFTAEDEEMIYGVFRNEFGFDGFVMTDWNSYDTIDIVSAIQAGNGWMTPGSTDDTYVKPIIEGVRDGRIEIERLRSNIRYMLRVVQKRTGVDLGV